MSSGRKNGRGSKGSVAWSVESGGTVGAGVVGTPEVPPESPAVATRERVAELEGLLAAANDTIGRLSEELSAKEQGRRKLALEKERAERKCRAMERRLNEHGIDPESDDDGEGGEDEEEEEEEQEGGRERPTGSPPMMRVTTSRIVGL